MSIFKALEDKIAKQVEDYTAYLSDLNAMPWEVLNSYFIPLSNIFNDKPIEDIEACIVESSYRKEKYDYVIYAIYITGSKEFIELVDQQGKK